MIAQVILLRRMPLKLAVLDYAVPVGLEAAMAVGKMVEVPFRNIFSFGIVKNLVTAPVAAEAKKIKEVLRIVLERPLCNVAALLFFEELSKRYHASLGFLLKNALPPLLPKTFKTFSGEFFAPPKPVEQLALTLERETRPRLNIYKTLAEKKKILQALFKSKGQVLVLVPEVSDIEATAKLFPATARKNLQIVTSKTTIANWRKIWQRIWQHTPTIILGTRRALYLPFTELKRIIVIDEGNPVYKSWDMAPRFETRDAAELLAQCHVSELQFVTHTPTVETWTTAEAGQFAYGENKTLGRMPAQIVNMIDERRGGNKGAISDELLQATVENTTGASFLYLQRRGDAHYIACRDCGHVFKCPNCRTSLTAFDATRELKCQHCNHREPQAAQCPNCQGATFFRQGAGAPSIVQELRRVIPAERRIVILEKENEIDEVEKFEPGTLVIGTAYAFARVDWQDISLFAFVSADISLFVPEYQAMSELWFLIRAANIRIKQAPFIQTNHPEHPIFKALSNPVNFYNDELAGRRIFGYPPFCLLVKIFAGFPTSAIANDSAQALMRVLQPLTAAVQEFTIMGPVELMPAVLRGLHYRALIVKISGKNSWELLKKILNNVGDDWKIDVQPRTLITHS